MLLMTKENDVYSSSLDLFCFSGLGILCSVRGVIMLNLLDGSSQGLSMTFIILNGVFSLAPFD